MMHAAEGAAEIGTAGDPSSAPGELRTTEATLRQLFAELSTHETVPASLLLDPRARGEMSAEKCRTILLREGCAKGTPLSLAEFVKIGLLLCGASSEPSSSVRTKTAIVHSDAKARLVGAARAWRAAQAEEGAMHFDRATTLLRRGKLVELDLSGAALSFSEVTQIGACACAASELVTISLDGGRPLHVPTLRGPCAGSTRGGTPTAESIDLCGRGLGAMSAALIGALIEANKHLRRLHLADNALCA